MSSRSSAIKPPFPGALEIRRLTPELEESLAVFFEAMRAGPDASWFHPHPLNAEAAARISNSSGLDLYYAMVAGTTILAYGMLRGWDEGYEVPSLGIAVHPDARGRGLGSLLVRFLHLVARQRGATSIRLTVYKDNVNAVTLYRNHGYRFSPISENEWLGVTELLP